MATQLLLPQRSTFSMGDNTTKHDEPMLNQQPPSSPDLLGESAVPGAAPSATVSGSAVGISSMSSAGSNGNMAAALAVPVGGNPRATFAASLSSPASSSFAGRGAETSIVSHLRRSLTGTSTGSGSPRQDIESKLKAKGFDDSSLQNNQNTVDSFSLNGGIGNFTNFNNSNTSSNVSNSMASSSSSSSLNAASAGNANGKSGGQGLMVQGSNTNSNNLAAFQAAIASGNPIAALLLRDQANLEAALFQVASLNAGMIMQPTAPGAMLLAAHLGNFGGNFSGLAAAATAATGKIGSVLDPRLAGGAFFSGSGMASAKPRRKPLSLYMECDTDSLSEYQCLIRQQIELFEADQSEAASSVQGRNKQIVEGQVGIRCRHCAHLPSRQRQKGSMYFPTKLDRIYQAAQNLSTFHLCDNCKYVPDHVRKKILLLRERKSPAGGGKRYWGEGVRCLGVVEDESGLHFR